VNERGRPRKAGPEQNAAKRSETKGTASPATDCVLCAIRADLSLDWLAAIRHEDYERADQLTEIATAMGRHR